MISVLSHAGGSYNRTSYKGQKKQTPVDPDPLYGARKGGQQRKQ